MKCTTLIVADLADGSSLALCRARSSVRLLTLAAVCGIAAGVVHAGSLWPLGDVTAIHCCPANDLRPADKPFFLRELHGNLACRDLNGNWS